MFQALELLYLLFLAANIAFIFEFDIHLLRHSLWQGFPLRIKRRNQIIVEFRTLDELSKRNPCLQRCRLQCRQNLSIPGTCADMSLCQTLFFRCDCSALCPQSGNLFLADQAQRISPLRQSQIRIVLTQKQSVFRARSHHSIRLMALLSHKVIDQDPNVSLRSC